MDDQQTIAKILAQYESMYNTSTWRGCECMAKRLYARAYAYRRGGEHRLADDLQSCADFYAQKLEER